MEHKHMYESSESTQIGEKQAYTKIYELDLWPSFDIVTAFQSICICTCTQRYSSDIVVVVLLFFRLHLKIKLCLKNNCQLTFILTVVFKPILFWIKMLNDWRNVQLRNEFIFGRFVGFLWALTLTLLET